MTGFNLIFCDLGSEILILGLGVGLELIFLISYLTCDSIPTLVGQFENFHSFFFSGYIFVSDIGYRARIVRYHSAAPTKKTRRSLRSQVEGRTIVGLRLQYPSGIAVDFYTNRIFWADAKRSVIESSSADGKNRYLVRDFGDERPYKITVSEDWIFGTTFLTNKIFRIKKYAHLENLPKQDSFMTLKSHEIDKIRWIDALSLSRPMLTVLHPIKTEIVNNYKRTITAKCEKCSDKQLCLNAGNTKYFCLDECKCKPGFICKKNGRTGDMFCEAQKVMPFFLFGLDYLFFMVFSTD